MVIALCPYCRNQNWFLPKNFDDRVQCNSCAKMFFVEIKDGITRSVFPSAIEIDPPKGLDPELSSDLKEACVCFSVEAYKASVVMCRRFLEGLLDKKGFKGDNLLGRIKKAYEAGAVSEVLYHSASSARILGNYGAHFSDDALKQIGRSEAELVLTMVKQIVKAIS